MHSQKIELENLENTRDLAGIINKDGYKIKKGKLIRSSSLKRASDADLRKLHDEYGVKTIVDFRSKQEIMESPDKLIGKQKLFINTILKERAAGITHDKQSEKEVEIWEHQNPSPELAKRGMIRFYRQMAQDYSTAAYKNFLQHVLTNDQTILWHCAVGKDRCGIGTVLVLSALDVDRESIVEDYLYSNYCLHFNESKQQDAKYYTDWVHFDYIDEYFKKVNELYGTMDNYLQNYLGIGKEEKQILKDKYLQRI